VNALVVEPGDAPEEAELELEANLPAAVGDQLGLEALGDGVVGVASRFIETAIPASFT
jgi:hypothetical protein